MTPDALTLPADPYDCQLAQSFKRIQATGATIEPDRLTCGDSLDKMQSTAVPVQWVPDGWNHRAFRIGDQHDY